MNIYFLKINTKLLLNIFIYVLVSVNLCTMSLSNNSYLNDYGQQSYNLYNLSGGIGVNFMPYPRTNDSSQEIVPYNETYLSLNAQADTVIQTFNVVHLLGFFPFTGIEYGFTTLTFHLTKLLSDKTYKYGYTNYVCIFIGPETNSYSILRCVPQFGLGVSYSDMPRNINQKTDSKKSNIIEIKNMYDTNKILNYGIIFINKYIIKIRLGNDYELHLHIGYSYNHLFYKKENKLNSDFNELIGSCGNGIFNIFINTRINCAWNKRLEDPNWFNDGFLYKIEQRKYFLSLGAIALGKYYTKDVKNVKNILQNNYYGANLDFSIPFLFHFSEIHYLGLYLDVIFALWGNKTKSIPNIFKIYSNVKCGIIICSQYKSFRSEHRFGGFIFTNGKLFGTREISQQTYNEPNHHYDPMKTFQNQKKLLKYTLSDHFTYSYKIYFSIPKILIQKYLKNLIKISSIYIAVNLILWTKMNNKTYHKVDNGYRINYSLAKLDSISIGICL